MYGYHGKMLWVDLTYKKTEIREISDDVFEKYIGGSGLCAKIMMEETDENTDPLGPENVMVAFTGPFTGTGVPAGSRHHMMARSPLTGILGETNIGGSWAVHFKAAGFDGIAVTGKAEKPTYLWISDDGVEFRDATPVWGQDTIESADWLKAQTTKKATVAVIGQAGEQMVRIASISHIGTIVRSAGRTGMGAVMGSKNLKAMVTYGTQKTPLADKDGLKSDIKEYAEHVKKVTEAFRKFGTAGGVDNYSKMGNFPVQNWRGSQWEGSAKISGATMHDTVLTGRTACRNCPIICGRHVKVTEGPWAPIDGEGPEYETVGTMGGECLVEDLEAICKANDLCNRYGLDTMSTGSVIAFAMECYENGLITKADTDGIDLVWGSAEALIAMIEKIGKREGFGKLLGEGSTLAAKKIGQNAIEYVVAVKGLETSAHDPRRFWSQALNYATAARGGCHNASWGHAYELALYMPELGQDEPFPSYTQKGLVDFTINMQNYQSMNDALVQCRFSQVGKAVTPTNLATWLSLITGRSIEVKTLMEAGSRIFNLKRMFNTRLGISRKDDTLPPRFLSHNPENPNLDKQLPPVHQWLGEYYEKRNWSETGIPKT
jgi:aldehyde:ferredoxin oxidoreductase